MSLAISIAISCNVELALSISCKKIDTKIGMKIDIVERAFGDFCLDFRQHRTTFVDFNRDFNPENRQVERPLKMLVRKTTILDSINLTQDST
jgi:hypothetical protein